ncbi:ATP-binding cassette domain-containing protein, partial [Acinetobacter baumannii]|uniref:ATP-binding cassette domain-containing protein n=1 Tax=Acinetobacter baumannii TaxID=470 RepID=UPI0034D223EB
MPEDRRIFPGLTVEENLRLGFMQAPGIGSAEKKRKLDDIFSRFPRLAERRHQMGTTLSGGEQPMLAFARVLTGRPRLL